MLRARLLVAAIGVPVGVAVVVLGGPYYVGLVGLLTLLALHEFYTLVRPYRPNLLVGYLGAIGILTAVYFAGIKGLAGAMAASLALFFAWGMGGRLGHHLVGRMAVTAFGLFWVVTGFAHLLLLRELANGMTLTILAVGATWTNDTAAFFVGRLFGRRRMAPRISPKKTMEGAVGGLVGSVLFALVVKMYSPWLPIREAAILGAVIGVVGQWGDLFESMVKRDLKRKDSGRLLPGHGGVLDRFDSLLFVGVATYWTAVLFLGDLVAVTAR
ncbi:MAG: phosphatidate cytidylyltransferase [Thermoleophilia bacterium]